MTEQNGAEVDIVVDVDSTREQNPPLNTTAIPETVAAKSSGSVSPEETLTVGVPEVVPEDAHIRNQPEARPDGPGVKGLPAGENGAPGKLKHGLGCVT